MKIIFLFLMISLKTFAHGEDVPGPHGGHIRMPATFHTELVINNEITAQIYLLDLQFEHPVIKDSSVTAIHKYGKTTFNLKCTPSVDHFRCLSRDPLLKGTLSIKANRLGVKASKAAVYNLPLAAFEAPSVTAPATAPVIDNSKKPAPLPPVDHSKHH